MKNLKILSRENKREEYLQDRLIPVDLDIQDIQGPLSITVRYPALFGATYEIGTVTLIFE